MARDIHNVFLQSNVFAKLEHLETMGHQLLLGKEYRIPEKPYRDVAVAEAGQMPKKIGLSQSAGQGLLVHNLANIELQAMES